MIGALETFDEGLRSGELWWESGAGAERAPVAHWHSGIGSAELSVLRRCNGPVLDVGCGPGRMVGYLSSTGIEALGVDVSSVAVSMTRRRGARALRGDVFSLDLPSSFETVLLVDGNVGIGGDPGSLLSRSGELLSSTGRILCEFAPADVDSSTSFLTLRSGSGVSEPFPWATVSISDASALARSSGLRVLEVWHDEPSSRCFAALSRSS